VTTEDEVAKKKISKKLLYFVDHEDQEAKDLEYGGQKDACKKRSKAQMPFEDHSISGDWQPGED
jgi:hypothetical protein